jgi:hypothetical protein
MTDRVYAWSIGVYRDVPIGRLPWGTQIACHIAVDFDARSRE